MSRVMSRAWTILIALIALLPALGGCNSSNGGSLGVFPDSGSDSPDGVDGASCPGPIATDAGVTSLDDLPVQALCAESPGRLFRWTDACAGSIVVVLGEGVDCASYWLFDATTDALQATAHGCNVGPLCTGAVDGFRFPRECFSGDGPANIVKLCP
jgi:hypothetical protein